MFTPLCQFNTLFNFNALYGHAGSRSFHGSYDELKYQQFLSNVVNKQGIDNTLWPYHSIENDFYRFNSFGYRTIEFDSCKDIEFDLVFGCSYVEGIGVRETERWTYFYEQFMGTKVVNLGKGGASNTFISMVLSQWINSNMPLPKRIIILWTNPLRETYIKNTNDPEHVSSGFNTLAEKLDHISRDIHKNFMTYINCTGQEFWSNNFMKNFAYVNSIAKVSNIPIYNYIANDLWPLYNLADFGEWGSATPQKVLFDRVEGWYYDSRIRKKIYPAADGVHFGKEHQEDVAKQITDYILYEENRRSI